MVVNKIDRLTRSLGDFSKMVDVFDAAAVSFVSITQQFNTTTLMGRLTLNVLLSFAQFEREVTAERIRDKIAASKKKGMWMGGVVPLGYRVENRKLLVQPDKPKLSELYSAGTSICGRSERFRKMPFDQAFGADFVPMATQLLASAAAIFATCSPTQSTSAKSVMAMLSTMANTNPSYRKTCSTGCGNCFSAKHRGGVRLTTQRDCIF